MYKCMKNGQQKRCGWMEGMGGGGYWRGRGGISEGGGTGGVLNRVGEGDGSFPSSFWLLCSERR